MHHWWARLTAYSKSISKSWTPLSYNETTLSLNLRRQLNLKRYKTFENLLGFVPVNTVSTNNTSDENVDGIENREHIVSAPRSPENFPEHTEELLAQIDRVTEELEGLEMST